MFGYVVVNKPEIRIREFEEYRAYYCGLCKSLKKRYGLLGRLSLNYDITFLLMLLSSLYEPETVYCERRCIAHGFEKQKEKSNVIDEYAADMNMLLAYYKCLDDWKDERKFSRLIYSKIAGRKLRANGVFDNRAQEIERLLVKLDAEEKKGVMSCEEFSLIFGDIMGNVFSYRDDYWKESLKGLGFYLGKFIYVLDAYDDYEEDKKNGRFNPLKGEKIDEEVNLILSTSAARMSEFFEKLPIVDNVEIMRNILYAGIWLKYEEIKEKRNDESV